LLTQPHAFRQPQCDHRLTEYVLHRLAKAQIDPQRERGHQLCEPYWRNTRIGGTTHRADGSCPEPVPARKLPTTRRSVDGRPTSQETRNGPHVPPKARCNTIALFCDGLT